jgi:hypothetical protein
MTVRNALLFLISLVIIASCRHQAPRLSARIAHAAIMDTLPSASGLEWTSGRWFIVSDDAPRIYALTKGLESGTSFDLHAGASALGRRMPKSIKRDLESLVSMPLDGDTLLLALASGSMSPWRDSALIFNPAEPGNPRWYSLRPFYDALMQQHHIDTGKLNMEGAARLGNHLLLFNRGTNTIYSVSLQAFLSHLTKPGHTLPAANATPCTLPVYNGLQARFSGACTIPGTDSLIMCASLEDTPSATADGEVLGSYIGIASIDQSANAIWAPVLRADGTMAKEKIESVAFAGRTPEGAILVRAVADNDDGSSGMLLLQLSFSKK